MVFNGFSKLVFILATKLVEMGDRSRLDLDWRHT